MSAELDMVIEVIEASGLNTAALSIAERRTWLASGLSDEPPPDATVERREIAGRPAERITADGVVTASTILWFHGGAFTAGGLGTHRRFAANLSRACEVTVTLLDYRLAPEDPFPGAVDDACSALDVLFDTDGLSRGEVLVGGDSAGGGLALSAMLAQRDRQRPVPGGAILLSPWVDLAMRSASYVTEAPNDPLCSREALEVSAAAYLGDHDRTDPLCSALYGDLTGLPPMLLHVGSREVLRDESLELVAAAKAAGVEVSSWVAPGMIHCWHLFAGMVPESDEALAMVGAWAREHRSQ